jgi:hypothetical protein
MFMYFKETLRFGCSLLLQQQCITVYIVIIKEFTSNYYFIIIFCTFSAFPEKKEDYQRQMNSFGFIIIIGL